MPLRWGWAHSMCLGEPELLKTAPYALLSYQDSISQAEGEVAPNLVETACRRPEHRLYLLQQDGCLTVGPSPKLHDDRHPR